MHLGNAGGGAADGAEPVIVRSLTREYRLHAGAGRLAELLRFLSAAPEMPGIDLAPLRVDFEGEHPLHRMHLPGGGSLSGDAATLREHLHRILVRGLLQERPDGAMVHAASIAAGEERILLAGRKTAGKTTLVLRLLAEGFQVEGDEHVALLGDAALARPRRLRVKPGSLAFVPELAKAILASPSIIYDGVPLYSVEPSLGREAWRIAPGRIAHFVFLEPNHGGRSVLAPLPAERAMEWLVPNAIGLSDDRLKVAILLRRHLLGARSWRLSLGDHENAVTALKRLAC